MIFSWLKLGIGFMTLVICLGIAVLAWLFISNMALELTTSIAVGCTAFLIAIAVYYFIMSRLGYSIKMGHLAIIERAHRGEEVPSNPVEFSKTVVSERFGGNRQYYAYSRNISITVKQLIRVISRGFSLNSESPDIRSGRWIKQFLSLPALRCIDECSLAFALRKQDYEVTAACVDALTILVQSWEPFSRKALKVSLIHIAICLATFALFFVPGIALFSSFGIILPWIGISFFIMLTIKVGIYDSYVLTKMVSEFLTISNETQIEQKNYVKLDSWSKSYAKLRKSAEAAAEKAEDEADRAERAARKAAKKQEDAQEEKSEKSN